MIGLLWIFFFSSAQIPEALSYAWSQRHIVLMGIDSEIQPLPSSLVNAYCPPLRMRSRLLPVDRYYQADRERNRRLYGEDTVKLDPTLIVLHFTVVDDVEACMRIFTRPSRLMVGNQSPVTSLVSVHYMVDVDGTVLKLVPEDRRTTGTYGVDHRALAIEMVARDEVDLLSRPRQLLAAFCLVDGLLKKHKLPLHSVISHQEVASGKFFLSEYTDLADTVYPYFYPPSQFRYDPGSTTMAWCREFLLRKRGLWSRHPASGRKVKTRVRQKPPPRRPPFDGQLIRR